MNKRSIIVIVLFTIFLFPISVSSITTSTMQQDHKSHDTVSTTSLVVWGLVRGSFETDFAIIEPQKAIKSKVEFEFFACQSKEQADEIARYYVKGKSDDVDRFTYSIVNQMEQIAKYKGFSGNKNATDNVCGVISSGQRFTITKLYGNKFASIKAVCGNDHIQTAEVIITDVTKMQVTSKEPIDVITRGKLIEETIDINGLYSKAYPVFITHISDESCIDINMKNVAAFTSSKCKVSDKEIQQMK